MDDKKVKQFLRYYHRNVVDFALELAELDSREREAIELCGRQRLTIERSAELAGVSACTMQARYASARKRLIKAWSGLEWIELLADTVHDD